MLKGMSIPIPVIPESEQTPLVQRLLEIIHQQAEILQQLRDEIAILEGLKPKPKTAPSQLEAPPSPKPAPDPTTSQKRPGSDDRPAVRWHGTYAEYPGGPIFTATPHPGVSIQVATGEAGLTMAFGLADAWWETEG